MHLDAVMLTTDSKFISTDTAFIKILLTDMRFQSLLSQTNPLYGILV